jgi:hypothetical protein
LNSTKNFTTKIDSNINLSIFSLEGPAAVRAQFFPRQRITIIEAGKILGIGYHQIWRLNKAGRLRLRIRTCDADRSYILLDDLIQYLFSSAENTVSSHTKKTEKKKLGRPRKSVTGNGGGVK